MTKITFIGAGSSVFVKNVLGDCMLTEALRGIHMALFDIDAQRLDDSLRMLENLNGRLGRPARITAHLDRREALRGADYVVNAIQVGGYDPCTITDFEVPKRFGLRQTIGDTLGIGGIFRALRTIPVMLDIARDMEEVCPNALLMNYTNPMGMITGAVLRATSVRCVGLCHSVQVCAPHLLESLGMPSDNINWKIAGVNHQAWLLEITRGGVDLYPEIKRRALELPAPHQDMVRLELMRRFGYYLTESSEHSAEYLPYFIKNTHPELIEKLNIPLDEYPRRCVELTQKWAAARVQPAGAVTHERTHEYASYMIEAMETGAAYAIGGNVLNRGVIPNLPAEACVEVPCLVDGSGVTPCYVGALPEQLAALNRGHINVQLLTVKAALERKREYIYHAAMLDPHTSSELTLDEITALCDALIEAHGDWLPEYR